MEQDRAPTLLPHHGELAWDSADDLRTIVDRIGNTRTAAGRRVQVGLDAGEYPTGMKVNKAQLDAMMLVRDGFHGDWNYKFTPR